MVSSSHLPGHLASRRHKLLWLLALTIPCLLGIHKALIVPEAWTQREWASALDDKPIREILTRHPRIWRYSHGLLAQPIDSLMEWKGFFYLPSAVQVVVRCQGDTAAHVQLDRRLVFEGPCGNGKEGALVLEPGTQELLIRAMVPPIEEELRFWLRLDDGESIPLEDFAIYPEPVTREIVERSRWLRPVLHSALLGSLLASLFLLASLLRSEAAGNRRLAEVLMTIMVLSAFVFLRHGSGLMFWGTAFLEGASLPLGGLVLMLGLLPWLLTVSGRRVEWPAATPSLVVAVTLGITWLLRERFLWGDGWTTLEILEGRHEFGPLGPYFWKEPLDRLIAVGATRIAEGLGAGAAEAIAFTSCLAGAWAMGSLQRHRHELVGWELGALCTAGGATVFFGHIENYSWVTAALILFLLAAVRSVQEKRSLLPLGGLGGLAIAFHPIACLQVVPTLCAVALLRIQGGSSIRRVVPLLLLGVAVVPTVLLLASILAGISPPEIGLNRFSHDEQVFLGLREAFSSTNLWRVFNRILLLTSPGILFALFLGALRGGWPRRQTLVVLASCAGALFHLAFFHAKLEPVVRDWDLFAPTYVPLAFLAGRALGRESDRTTRIWATGLSWAILLLGLISEPGQGGARY